jgi:hypothetical protein
VLDKRLDDEGPGDDRVSKRRELHKNTSRSRSSIRPGSHRRVMAPRPRKMNGMNVLNPHISGILKFSPAGLGALPVSTPDGSWTYPCASIHTRAAHPNAPELSQRNVERDTPAKARATRRKYSVRPDSCQHEGAPRPGQTASCYRDVASSRLHTSRSTRLPHRCAARPSTRSQHEYPVALVA